MASYTSSDQAPVQPKLGLAGKVGAALYALWGILHIWVGWFGMSVVRQNAKTARSLNLYIIA